MCVCVRLQGLANSEGVSVTHRACGCWQIKNKFCSLVGPTDVVELTHLLKKEMSPAQLLLALQRCGINLMPVNDDAAFVAFADGGDSPVVKNDDVERRTLEDVAGLAAAFSATYSRWNQGAGADKCVLRMKETLDYDEAPSDVHETDWRCVAVRVVVPGAGVGSTSAG